MSNEPGEASVVLPEEGHSRLKWCIQRLSNVLHYTMLHITLPLLHCITPCHTSLYHCYTALHHVTHHSTTVTLHYTMLHNIVTITYLWGECTDNIVTLGEHLDIKYHPVQWLGWVAGVGLACEGWNVTITDELIGRIPVCETPYRSEGDLASHCHCPRLQFLITCRKTGAGEGLGMRL